METEITETKHASAAVMKMRGRSFCEHAIEQLGMKLPFLIRAVHEGTEYGKGWVDRFFQDGRVLIGFEPSGFAPAGFTYEIRDAEGRTILETASEYETREKHWWEELRSKHQAGELQWK